MGDTELSKRFSGTKVTVGALNNKLNSTSILCLSEFSPIVSQNDIRICVRNSDSKYTSKQVLILSLLRRCIVFQDPRMFQALKCCPSDHKLIQRYISSTHCIPLTLSREILWLGSFLSSCVMMSRAPSATCAGNLGD